MGSSIFKDSSQVRTNIRICKCAFTMLVNHCEEPSLDSFFTT